MHTCTAHPNMEHSLLRHYNFTAVRVAAMPRPQRMARAVRWTGAY